MAEIRLSPRALADIEAIHDYYDKERPSALAGVMKALLVALDQVALFPGSGRVAIATRDGRVYRVKVAGPCLVTTASLTRSCSSRGCGEGDGERRRRPTLAARIRKRRRLLAATDRCQIDTVAHNSTDGLEDLRLVLT